MTLGHQQVQVPSDTCTGARMRTSLGPLTVDTGQDPMTEMGPYVETWPTGQESQTRGLSTGDLSSADRRRESRENPAGFVSGRGAGSLSLPLPLSPASKSHLLLPETSPELRPQSSHCTSILTRPRPRAPPHQDESHLGAGTRLPKGPSAGGRAQPQRA